MIASIRGQSQHICEALEANNGRIDNTFNVPAFFKSEFDHWLTIRGFQWRVVYNTSVARNKRQVVPQPSQQTYSDRSLDSQPLVSLESYNGTETWTELFKYRYVVAFGAQYFRNSTKHSVLIGGLTVRHSMIC